MRNSDTRTNPLGGRDYPSPSNMTRIGSGIHFAAASAIPLSETDGVPVEMWTSVHVIFYADRATYAGLVGLFRPWRWYPQQPLGQSGATGVEVGRWVSDFEITAALDPTRISPTVSSHYVWDTRGASKMFWQFLGTQNANGDPGATPTFVIAQPFGYTDPDDSMAVSVPAGTGGGSSATATGGGLPNMMGVQATHWTPANGTATWASAVTLTMAGFPFVVDDANCTVMGVVVRNNTNDVTQYINGVDGVSLTATAGVLTIIDPPVAAPFLATDLDYYVYLLYEEKAYDETPDAYRTEEVAPLNDEYTQPAYVVNDVAVVAGGVAYPSADGIVMDGYKDIQFQIYLLGGQTNAHADTTITIRFQGSNDVVVGGVRQWADLGVGYDLNADNTVVTWAATGIVTPLGTQIDFDNWMGKRIRLFIDTFAVDPGADHPAACVVTERRKAL